MEMQKTLKTVLMTATLCALAGLANSAAAAEVCKENDGYCHSKPVNAGPERKVAYRCTLEKPGDDRGRCRIVEMASGKSVVNEIFVGDTGDKTSPTLPNPGEYRCAVGTNGPNLRGHKVYCRIN